MLTLKGLTVSAGNKIILQNLDWHFEKGKTYVVMGPNGSGKSTLVRSIIGDKSYRIKGEVIFKNKNITGWPVEKIARAGIYLSFQNPPAVDGVTVYQLFFALFGGKENILATKEKIDKIAESLQIKPELLNRSLNVNFSGGEKKKLEVLQALLINPKLVIFDEIDSGVDMESLKIIFANLLRFKTKEKTLIFITHYEKILEYFSPDLVLTIKDGTINK